MPSEETELPKIGKQLLDATRPFAVESSIRSWWSVGSTLVVLGATLAVAAFAPWWPLRLTASVLAGLLLVRTFIPPCVRIVVARRAAPLPRR
jgi:omega-6 fatty acid desaturase (delta-12 desaturase)